MKFYLQLSDGVLYSISGVICIVMTSDYVMSHFIMKFVKTSVESSEADNTESISKEIKLLLSNKSILYARIANAYPDVIYRTERIKNRMQQVKTEMEKMKEEATKRVEELKKIENQIHH